VLNELAASAGMSARGVHRVVRVARTVADLEDCEHVSERHVLAAAGLREPDAPWMRAA
jgi:magnesium chelatase family protein